jgi:hypothetical protein
MKHLLLLPCLLLAACSSPAFRKSESEPGYTVHDSTRREIFNVRAKLPAGTKQEQRLAYLTRAAGEECLARGFLFWDIGPLSASSLRAFCYKGRNRKSLGVILNNGNIKQLTVQDTVVNSRSPFQANDVVRKIGGVDVDTAGDFKEQIFLLAENGAKDVTVKVERSGIALSLSAPFSEQRETVLTPEILEDLRKKVP